MDGMGLQLSEGERRQDHKEQFPENDASIRVDQALKIDSFSEILSVMSDV